MHSSRAIRSIRLFLASVGAMVALLTCGPAAGMAQAAEAGPAGDTVVLGNPDAPGQIDLYLDPLCPYSGELVRTRGDEIGRRLESGALRVNLRWVDFLDKYSASGTYDDRAIYATFVVSDQSKSSGTTWRFVQQIYSAAHQPKEEGPTDLGNDEMADLAAGVGAPQPAQDLIRIGLPIGFDSHAIAARNLVILRSFPKSGVPLVVIDDRPVDEDADWLAKLPR